MMPESEDKSRKTWKMAGRPAKWESDKSQILQIKEGIKRLDKEGKAKP